MSENSDGKTEYTNGPLRLHARELRHAHMRKLADEAMADPGFVADMRETMEAFGPIDAELWSFG